MEIYNSTFLSIDKQDDTLFQTWNNTILSPEDFKQELQSYLSFFKKITPENVIWDNSNFKLDIPPNLFNWVEQDILKPQYESGLKNLRFIVSNNTMAQISVMKSVENVQENLKSFYFNTKEAAINHLNTPKQSYHIDDTEVKNNVARLIIDLNYDKLPETIEALENIKRNKEFRFQNQFKFDRLTIRELEIFKLVVLGKLAKEIAVLLCIEYSTVTTHKKNIIKKLELRSFYDWYLYAKSFGILKF